MIRRSARYLIGGEQISRRELLERVAPAIMGLAEAVRKGVAMKWAAVGVGTLGGLTLGGGLMCAFFSAVIGDRESVKIGWAMVGAGALIGGASVGLAIASVRAQKRSMWLYNNDLRYLGASPRRSLGAEAVTLSMATTRGGLGLQLTF